MLAIGGLAPRPGTSPRPVTARRTCRSGAAWAARRRWASASPWRSRRKPVLVITGDGEMLMGVGSLATIATKQPRNLSVVVLDNEHYGETGMQETATRHGVDLAGMAKAAGIADSRKVTTPDEVLALRDAIRAGHGPIFAQVKIDAASLPLVLPPREASILQARMREAILGPKAHLQ